MGAALFGAEQLVAIDNDPEAVRVAGENIAHNMLEGKITVSGDGLDELTGSFDLVCANIIHDVLVDMAPDIVQLLDRKRERLSWLVSSQANRKRISLDCMKSSASPCRKLAMRMSGCPCFWLDKREPKLRSIFH